MINRHLDDECTNSGAISDIESPEHLLDERASRANSYREPTKHFCDTTESSSSRTSLIKPTAFKPVTLNNIASSSSTSTNEIITRSKPSRRLSTPSPKQKQQEKRQPKITGESPTFYCFFCYYTTFNDVNLRHRQWREQQKGNNNFPKRHLLPILSRSTWVLLMIIIIIAFHHTFIHFFVSFGYLLEKPQKKNITFTFEMNIQGNYSTRCSNLFLLRFNSPRGDTNMNHKMVRIQYICLFFLRHTRWDV